MTARTDGDDTRLVELLLHWEELRDQGRTVTPEELCETCPELAEDLARRIAMLREIAPLLDGPTTADGHPNGPAPAEAPTRPSASASAAFRDLRFHAAGGLGVVYTARNAELNRDVALKFLKPDRARDPESRRRFLQEAEVTGRLEHPGVVPIYALGTDAAGSPCYAMRFIRGETLQDAIDAFHSAEKPSRDPSEGRLALRELLDRFVSICGTMAYAHSRGILHRDLKPRNIMLGKYGETLVVDWGLAKPFDRDQASRSAGEETLKPGAGSGGVDSDTPTVGVVGTPAYMSPEQAEAGADLVGPASDLFALGAILYAILTGRPPYRAKKAGEILEKVKRCEFPPPRQVKPGVHRALQAICLKAMARRPEERYGSAVELAADLRRWLADEPVLAYREPMAARLRRRMRRHRTLMTSLAASVLAGLVAVAAVQNHSNQELRAANERASRALEAERIAGGRTAAALVAETRAKEEKEAALKRSGAVLKFLKDDILSVARPEGESGGLGKDLTVRQAIDAAEPKIAGAFKDEPIVEAEIRHALGETYYHLGEFRRAARQLERAAEIRRARLGADHPETLSACNDLGIAYDSDGRVDDAIRLHEQTRRLLTARLGPEHRDTLVSSHNLATSYEKAGRVDDAIRLLEETNRIQKARLGPDHPDLLVTRNNLATAYGDAGRLDDAIRLHEETLKAREARLGPDHPDTALSRHNLASDYRKVGRIDDAIRLFEKAARDEEVRLGPDHPSTLITRKGLAWTYVDLGRVDEAIRLFERSLGLSEARNGPDHPDTLGIRDALAVAFHRAGRIDDAIRLHEETLTLAEARLGPDHPTTLTIRNNLAVDYDAARRYADAARLHEEIRGLREARNGPDHPDTLISAHNLALAYERGGRIDEAIRLHERTRRLSEARNGPDHPDTLRIRDDLAVAYEKDGRLDAAIRLREGTVGLREKRQGPHHRETITAREFLALAYEKARRFDAMVASREWLLASCKARLGPDHLDTFQARSNLASAYSQTARYRDAAALHGENTRLLEAKLGPDDPRTLRSRSYFAVDTGHLGRFDREAALLEPTLREQQSKLGLDHFDTRYSRDNLAIAYEQLGRWAQAQPLRAETLARRRKAEPPDSPTLAWDLEMLANNLLSQAKWAEAEPILRECLAIREKIGPDDEPRYRVMGWLGAMLAVRRRYAEAEPLIVAVYRHARATAAPLLTPGRSPVQQAAERVIRLYEVWGKPEQAAAWRIKVGLADLPADVFAPP